MTSRNDAPLSWRVSATEAHLRRGVATTPLNLSGEELLPWSS